MVPHAVNVEKQCNLRGSTLDLSKSEVHCGSDFYKGFCQLSYELLCRPYIATFDVSPSPQVPHLRRSSTFAPPPSLHLSSTFCSAAVSSTFTLHPFAPPPFYLLLFHRFLHPRHFHLFLHRFLCCLSVIMTCLQDVKEKFNMCCRWIGMLWNRTTKHST